MRLKGNVGPGRLQAPCLNLCLNPLRHTSTGARSSLVLANRTYATALRFWAQRCRIVAVAHPFPEWAAYYDALGAAFGLAIDATDPDFGADPVLEVIAAAPALATFVGEQTHLIWPTEYDLRRIALHGPAPVYPHSLIWRRDNPHPALAALAALAALRDYLGSLPSSPGTAETWTPPWARRSASPAA